MGKAKRFQAVKVDYSPNYIKYDIPGTIGVIPDYLKHSKKKTNSLLEF